MAPRSRRLTCSATWKGRSAELERDEAMAVARVLVSRRGRDPGPRGARRVVASDVCSSGRHGRVASAPAPFNTIRPSRQAIDDVSTRVEPVEVGPSRFLVPCGRARAACGCCGDTSVDGSPRIRVAVNVGDDLLVLPDERVERVLSQPVRMPAVGLQVHQVTCLAKRPSSFKPAALKAGTA